MKKNNKVVKVLMIIGVVILIIVLIAFLFMKFWKPLGSVPSENDQKEYGKRASNYHEGKFKNENEYQMIYSSDDMENNFISKKGTVPKDKIKTVSPAFLEDPLISDLTITWFGHSTLLMQMHSMNILIDPIFSETTSPVSFIGPKRFTDLPIGIEELPKIDILVISHDHYDHLDYKTIKDIDEKVTKYIVPLGVENHLERWGVAPNKITNMAWWEEVNVNGLIIGCAPARHYSGRSLNDRYNTLWASWVFKDEYHQVFESGDTGFDKHFKEIYAKYGEFDLALLDSGQYDVRWRSTHMNPEESVEAGKILNAKVIMPIHWGAFVLANHPWDDSVARFTKKAEEENLKYITPQIGETINYDNNLNTTKWWIDIK